MSREKEIEEAAIKFYETNEFPLTDIQIFECGARWADANPAPKLTDQEIKKLLTCAHLLNDGDTVEDAEWLISLVNRLTKK